jgi:hypothetical protein
MIRMRFSLLGRIIAAVLALVIVVFYIVRR